MKKTCWKIITTDSEKQIWDQSACQAPSLRANSMMESVQAILRMIDYFPLVTWRKQPKTGTKLHNSKRERDQRIRMHWTSSVMPLYYCITTLGTDCHPNYFWGNKIYHLIVKPNTKKLAFRLSLVYSSRRRRWTRLIQLHRNEVPASLSILMLAVTWQTRPAHIFL